VSKEYSFTVRDLPRQERPRERLQKFGPEKSVLLMHLQMEFDPFSSLIFKSIPGVIGKAGK